MRAIRRMHGCLPLLCLGLVLVPSGALEAQSGVIEGTVTLEAPPPPRRSTVRYGGRAGGSTQVQQVPAVVYVVGVVDGAPGTASPVRMVQRDSAFVPAAVMVPVGGSVDFPNEDPFFHNVFSYSSALRFDLGRYPQGQSKSVRLDEPGVVGVFCEVHNGMRGVIIVTENPYHSVVADDGSFRIDGIPPGEYTVAFWSADHEPQEQIVTVTAGRPAMIEVELRR